MTYGERDYWEYRRRGSLFPVYLHHGPAWTRDAEDLYGFRGDSAIAYFSNDDVFFRVCRNETRRGAEVLGPRLLSSSTERQNFAALWRAAAARLRAWTDAVKREPPHPRRPAAIIEDVIPAFEAAHQEAQTVWTAKELLDAFLTDADPPVDASQLPPSASQLEEESLAQILREARQLDVRRSGLSVIGLHELIEREHPVLAQRIEAHVRQHGWAGATYAEVLARDEWFVLGQLLARDGDDAPTGRARGGRPLETHKRGVGVLQAFLFPLLEERREVLMQALVGIDRVYRALGAAFDLHPSFARWVLPGEWPKVLAEGQTDPTTILPRMAASYVTWDHGEMEWLTGAPAFQAERRFRQRWLSTDTSQVVGEVVVPGAITGMALLDIQALPASDEGLPWVLITGMTSPEMNPVLHRFAAVATDEGGVTCHAAAMCRERGVPCIINTRIGTRVFRTGDVVRLDGPVLSRLEKGEAPARITPVAEPAPPASSWNDAPDEAALPGQGGVEESWLDTLDVATTLGAGGKALALARMKQAGLPVPNGFVLRWGGDAPASQPVGKILDRPAIQQLFAAVDRVAVRSSAGDEDTVRRSGAGWYETFLDVPADGLAEAITACVDIMRSRGAPTAAVIVQEMVPAVLSGVAYVPNLAAGRWDQALIEAETGPGGVVGGSGFPQRYLCRWPTGEVERLDLVPTQEPSHRETEYRPFAPAMDWLDPGQVDCLVALLQQASALFSHPLDVEWAYRPGFGFYLLQARPLVPYTPKREVS